ncbi:MAG: diguanylate cyclase, partial [Arcobacteraceae bacterium]
ALVKIEQLRKLVEKIAVKIDAQTKLKFTASFGISDNSKSHNIDKILHNADELLYSAKNNGKNTIRSRFNNGE